MVVHCCIVKFTSFQRVGKPCYEYLFAFVKRNKVDSEVLTCLLKFIEYFPDNLSALSRTLLRFFWTTFVETAVYIFRGKYTSLRTGDILVRMLGSWEKNMVDQRSSRRIFKQVKHSVLYIELTHDLHACVNVLMHIDIFSGMYTSLGTGDILVRMCGSWEKIIVAQRRSRRIFKQVKHPVLYIELSHDLHAYVNVLMHIDMFSGMYTSLGTGDILVRMCGSWEKIMVAQRSSRRIFKQVKHSFYILSSHTTCTHA